mmetsp:Transcript_18345/g.47270  ORF Transcript_18345/g.47270 Transcript_18345/m.47270 type:complete len:198 (+) Transcript_18345:20-613(+)
MVVVVQRLARRAAHSSAGRLIRGRISETRSADAAWSAAHQAASAPKRGTFEFDAFKIPLEDIGARERLFADTKQSAIEHLEGEIARQTPGTPEYVTMEAELNELRQRTQPLGVLLTKPQGGAELQEGDVIKVRVIEMERTTRFIKCSRVYPRKAVLRVLHGSHTGQTPSDGDPRIAEADLTAPKWVSATDPAATSAP